MARRLGGRREPLRARGTVPPAGTGPGVRLGPGKGRAPNARSGTRAGLSRSESESKSESGLSVLLSVVCQYVLSPERVIAGLRASFKFPFRYWQRSRQVRFRSIERDTS